MENVNTIPVTKTLKERFNEMNTILERIRGENLREIEEEIERLRKEENDAKIKQRILSALLNITVKNNLIKHAKFSTEMIKLGIESSDFFPSIYFKKSTTREEKEEKVKEVDTLIRGLVKQINEKISEEIEILEISLKEKEYKIDGIWESAIFEIKARLK